MKDYPVAARVLDGSIACRAGIQPGDKIISINGHRIKDIFDYGYLITEENLDIKILKNDGSVLELKISKYQYEDLGIEFDTFLIDREKCCQNKCIFCFIDQLPRGMRKSLYFKDDDIRLSYLTGNYVTLTNIDEEELKRIVFYRLSPVNISVHTTNPELREKMLSNKKAGEILDKIKILTDGDILVNCQIVLCKGVNDGQELDRTLSDLYAMKNINSISVVPVGLTKYREGLYPLEIFTEKECEGVIRQLEKWQGIFTEKYGRNVVYAADELYIKAGLELPSWEHYDDFPQLENGVGMAALFKKEVLDYLEFLEPGRVKNKNRTVSIATGVCAGKLIKELATYICEKFPFVHVNVYTVINNFFGENVTVAGLLTGRDIYQQLKGRDLGEALLISSDMVKTEEDTFLDDMTIDKLKEMLGVNVIKVDVRGEDFVNNIIGINGGR